jgi:hypothetical protein
MGKEARSSLALVNEGLARSIEKHLEALQIRR